LTITVYTKKGCGLCEGLKDKLKRLSLAFEEKDIELLTDFHPGWREDGTVDIEAMHALIHRRVPMVVVDGKPYDYSAALARVKRSGDAAPAPRVDQAPPVTLSGVPPLPPEPPAKQVPDVPLFPLDGPELKADELLRELSPLTDGCLDSLEVQWTDCQRLQAEHGTISGAAVFMSHKPVKVVSTRVTAATLRELVRKVQESFVQQRKIGAV